MPGKPFWLWAKVQCPGIWEPAPWLPKAWAQVPSHLHFQPIHITGRCCGASRESGRCLLTPTHPSINTLTKGCR